MRNIFCASVVSTAIAAACFGTVAQAGESKISGFYPYLPEATAIELENGSSVSHFAVKGFLIVDDQSNPWHNALMDCFGSGAYASDGASAAVGGYCVIIDEDGDVQRLPWKENVAATGGTWEISAGIGKYANMTGSGTYINGKPMADGRVLNSWDFIQVTK